MAWKAKEWFKYGFTFSIIEYLVSIVVLLFGIQIITDVSIVVSELMEILSAEVLVGGAIVIGLIQGLAGGVAFIVWRWGYQQLKFKQTGFTKYAIIAAIPLAVAAVITLLSGEDVSILIFGVIEVIAVTWLTIKAYQQMKWRLPN